MNSYGALFLFLALAVLYIMIPVADQVAKDKQQDVEVIAKNFRPSAERYEF